MLCVFLNSDINSNFILLLQLYPFNVNVEMCFTHFAFPALRNLKKSFEVVIWPSSEDTNQDDCVPYLTTWVQHMALGFDPSFLLKKTLGGGGDVSSDFFHSYGRLPASVQLSPGHRENLVMNQQIVSFSLSIIKKRNLCIKGTKSIYFLFSFLCKCLIFLSSQLYTFLEMKLNEKQKMALCWVVAQQVRSLCLFLLHSVK